VRVWGKLAGFSDYDENSSGQQLPMLAMLSSTAAAISIPRQRSLAQLRALGAGVCNADRAQPLRKRASNPKSTLG
jgi:hypothetical protein